MNATNAFFFWFFYGLGGLGGWFLFFLVALAAVIWLLYDSQTRRLPAFGWRMGVILVAALLLPVILYRFTVNDPLDVTSPLAPFSEPIFYLGLLGGVLPPLIAVGYYVTFQGMVACPDGHVYEAALGQCPDSSHLPVAPVVVGGGYPEPMPMHMGGQAVRPSMDYGPPPPPPKPKAQAWLVSPDGHNYQLNLGETTIGRSATNDIQVSGDTTVGRQHAKIVEQNGHFRLIDLGAKNHTRVNNRIVRQPVMLEADDEVRFGDNTTMRFLKSGR